jgi:hypothetical protein
VDFGNCDEDGAVRLSARGTIKHLRVHGIQLAEGEVVRVSDGELLAEGRCTLRRGMWVVENCAWIQ